MRTLEEKYGIRTGVNPDSYSSYEGFKKVVTKGAIFRTLSQKEIDNWLKPLWNERTKSEKQAEKSEPVKTKSGGNKVKRKNSNRF